MAFHCTPTAPNVVVRLMQTLAVHARRIHMRFQRQILADMRFPNQIIDQLVSPVTMLMRLRQPLLSPPIHSRPIALTAAS